MGNFPREERKAVSRIVEKKDLSENVVRMVLEAPAIAKKRRAGQFIILKIDEENEKISLGLKQLRDHGLKEFGGF